MTDLPALRKRVEGLTGPDRGVEVSIWRRLDGGVAGREPLPWLNCYTESIDAALGLCDRLLPPNEGWAYSLHYDYGGLRRCHLNISPGEEARGWPQGGFNSNADAETMPLAIILALLRALESTNPDTEKADG